MAVINAPPGLLKALILKEASRAPLSAIKLIEKIGERTGGIWRPSPGSIYYLTNELESKGFLKKLKVEEERYPKYIITLKGKEELENIVIASKKDILKILTILKLYAEVTEDQNLMQDLENACKNITLI
ncbi:MAG: PadR family transcriptional regulator [Nitrososphaeria archaeon]|nr:PadR family transcriptional regulator [Nitrososphaeria archaeon]